MNLRTKLISGLVALTTLGMPTSISPPHLPVYPTKFKHRQYPRHPNCMGSLLFWIGEAEKETYATQKELKAVLDEKYERTDKPERWDIAVWKHEDTNFFISHAGLVEEGGRNPKILSRLGHGWECPIEVLTNEQILEKYKWDFKWSNAFYYAPKE